MSFEAEQRREEIERHAENSPRLAQAYAEMETEGQGSFEFEERVDFGLTFIEKPIPSYGLEFDIDEWANQLEGTYGEIDKMVPLPLTSGYVSAWDIDDRGFYIGCWLAVRVHLPLDEWELSPELMPVVQHFFTFTAIAMKDVPIDLRD